MKLSAISATLLLSLSLSGCDNPYQPAQQGGQPAGNPGGQSQGGYCPSNTFVGDLSGVQATARLGVEVLKGGPAGQPIIPNYPLIAGAEYLLIGGEIKSPQTMYSFTAELHGSTRGWGDAVDHSSGARFRIQLDFAPEGFYITPNPFGGGPLVNYYFKCQ